MNGADVPPYCYYKEGNREEDKSLFFNTAVNNNNQPCTHERKCVCKNGLRVQETEAGKIYSHYPWTSASGKHAQSCSPQGLFFLKFEILFQAHQMGALINMLQKK